VRDSGVQFTPMHERDALEARIDLMGVVEALRSPKPGCTSHHRGSRFLL
jgi:hypothetical protein